MLCGFEVGDFSANTKDLPDIGEIEVVIEFCAGPNLPDLQTAMSFIDRVVLRGENRAC